MPDKPSHSPKTITVSEAAFRLSVSERTIRRRCESGKIKATLETTGTGPAWLIDESDLRPSADTRENAASEQSRPIGQQDSAPAAKSADAADTPFKERYIDHLESENAFLRSTIEQLHRDGAEVRAALREAIKAAPKQLKAGDTSAPIEPETTEIPAPQQPAVIADEIEEYDDLIFKIFGNK